MKSGGQWGDKNVLVTGCNGFLGSWLIARLLEEGSNVVGLIRDVNPNSNLVISGSIEKIEVINGAIEDYNLVERAINEHEIDTCFHLAAQTIVGTAERSPLSTFESNIRGTWNVLESCRTIDTVKCVVIASTDKVYGTHEKLPYTEDFELKGLHPYDASKVCADVLAKMYFNTYGLPVGITRCGNIYGGGDLNFSRIIPGTIKALIYNQDPIIRSDGTFIRDYIYVKDVVDAYLILAQNLERKDVVGNAFNFSSSNPISVLDLVNKLIAISGKGNKPVIMNQAEHEIKDQYLSCKKANRILKWSARYSLDAGLAEAYKWYESFFR